MSTSVCGTEVCVVERYVELLYGQRRGEVDEVWELGRTGTQARGVFRDVEHAALGQRLVVMVNDGSERSIG